MTLNQILWLWSELESCYYNDNGWGGDTCEIYEYTVTPRSPGLDRTMDNVQGDLSKLSSISQEQNEEFTKDMWDDLNIIFSKFEKDKECKIEIDEPRGQRFHRIHVKVIRDD